MLIAAKIGVDGKDIKDNVNSWPNELILI
jgi:hypothetical protein